MAGWHLDTKMAQDIVARTMRIIDTNINVMDARGRIIGSGDRERIGELHEGALLVLSGGGWWISTTRSLAICTGFAGGLTCRCARRGDRRGDRPDRRAGVAAKIWRVGVHDSRDDAGAVAADASLARDSRLREELVMNLIQAEEHTPALNEWAQRLGIDLNQPRVVAMIEVDSGQLGVDSAMAELQQLQNALTTPDRNNLVAIVSLTEMVVLKPALNSFGRWDADDHVRRVEQLIAGMKENGQLRFRVALGNFFTGPGSIARSYRTARTTMMVGKQRMPESRSYFYQDLMLPVLLDSLRGGWQANELARPLARLKAMDNNGLLRRTLQAWFRHNVQPLATSKALFIHRNTLEYRLNRISELTGWISVALTTGCCCISRCSWTNNAKTWSKKKCRVATRHTRLWTMHAVWSG